MNVWCVRAEFGKYANNFRDGGYVALDYNVGEPLPIDSDRTAYIHLYKKYNPNDVSNVVIGQQVGQLTRFCEDIQSGDYVITPSERNDVLYYGKVMEEGYYFDESPTDGCPYRHRRRVKWSKKTASRSTFSVPFQNTIRSSLTVFSISQSVEFLTAINAEGFQPPEAPPTYNPYESVIEQVLTLDAQEFEILVGHLLTAIGFEDAEVTGRTGDGGVDATGMLDVSGLAKIRVYVQAKRYKQGSKINANVVKHLRTAIPVGGQGAFITTADFQKAAYNIATEAGFPRIGLINGRQLVDLLVEHWVDIPEDFRSKLGLKVGLVLSA